MNISTFLNPLDEQVKDDEKGILDLTIKAYAEGDRAQETDKEPVKFELIRQQEAMQAVQLLQRYKEQQDDGDGALIRQLALMEISVRGRIFNKRQQT